MMKAAADPPREVVEAACPSDERLAHARRVQPPADDDGQ
jgi:hypothetical protein